MNLRDLFIIYLACGAPFGVAYYLQNRNRSETKLLWLKSLFRFVFWIPFAVRMVARTSFLTNLYNQGFDGGAKTDADRLREIEGIRKYFENHPASRRLPLSIYELREIFDRYVGLSLELEADAREIVPAEAELFRVTNHPDKKLAAACLNRRNRKRLIFHRKLARRDFFEILDKLIEISGETPQALERAARLAVLLDDEAAPKTAAGLAEETPQTGDRKIVSQTGKEIWMSDQHTPLSERPISTNLQVLTATANSSNKD